MFSLSQGLARGLVFRSEYLSDPKSLEPPVHREICRRLAEEAIEAIVEKFIVTTYDTDRALEVHRLEAVVISRDDFTEAMMDAYKAGQLDMEMRRK